MIVKTESIVLRTVNFQESSIIATVFSRSHGKIALIAKGARKPKSKFAAFLVPGQILETVFYYKGSRSVQTLSDASYLEKLHNLRIDLHKIALVTTTMELCNQLLHENEVNEEVFYFLLKLIPWIDKQKTISKNLFPYIQIRLAEHSGIGLQLIEEQAGANKGYMNIKSGTVSTSAEDDHAIPLDEKQYNFIKRSLSSMNSTLFDVNFTGNEIKTLIQNLDLYFRFHVDGIRPRKSDKIFDQLLDD